MREIALQYRTFKRARSALDLVHLVVISLVCGTAFILFSCDSSETTSVVLEPPKVPLLSLNHETRGAFLGVWGEPKEEGGVWFVGGERSSDGESHSLIATYDAQGQIRLEDERAGGILWWVWGSGEKGVLWAAGEEGTILRRPRPVGENNSRAYWEQERIDLSEEVLEKLVIWGIWGMPNAGEGDELWAVGGSVRRGGPKGVLLKRDFDGVWRRVKVDLLPQESADDPLVGLNLYKIWGDGRQVWIVGEGSLTLTATLKAEAEGSWGLSEWSKLELGGDRPELIFTVSGHSRYTQDSSIEENSIEEKLLGPWAVGGYSTGRAWQWSTEGWAELVLPSVASLNGVASSDDLVLAVGARGGLLAWSPHFTPTESKQIHHQWIRGAESMTLHSTWVSPKGDFWIVGGDLTTLQSGVIITPNDWSQDYSPIMFEEW